MANEYTQASREAKALLEANTRFDWERLGLAVALLPVAPVLGMLVGGGTTSEDAKKARMPDSWLRTVADIPQLSDKGLAYLSGLLADKGWVSVAEAVEFLKREEAAQTARLEAESAARVEANGIDAIAPKGSGAAYLLARAERQLPGTLGRLTEVAGEIGQGAVTVGKAAVNVAGWAGSAIVSVAAAINKAAR